MAAEKIMLETRETITLKLVPMEGGDDENDPEYTKILMVHTRRIDDRFYKVTEHLNNSDNSVVTRTTETNMAEDEIENFEMDWELYWTPGETTTTTEGNYLL